MSNIVTLDFANKLEASQNRINIPISSLGGNKTTVKSKLNATIINGNSSFSTTLDFLVVSKITDFLPVSQINLNNLKIPQELADPNFGVPGKVDLLIGAEAFFDIIKEGIIRTTDNALVFRSSVFRYIATGTTHSYKQNQYCGFVSEMQNIDDNLQKFWEIETINEVQKPLSKEEEYCENHYQMTHTRNEAGRYVVQMPVKDIQCLGHSKGNFAAIHTHLDLEHMEKVEEHFDETFANNICYYLPHHGVFRPDKTTTKLKVVFNGSASTTSGLSLNDLLLKGEVKEDIFEIMIRLSAHKYAFTTEIRMMLRQILNDPAQRDLLRIIWKTGAIEEPVIYRLKTVTYGTSSAPFLAVRTLKQLAMDEASRFPFASKVALQDVYMDDIVSGAQDLDTARQLQCQLQNMLETCGMKLRKWNSNSKELLNSSSDQEHSFSTNAESAIKTLGSCIQARAVLDSGSMSNIVTLDFANKLEASQNRINIPISSLGGNKTTVKSKLNATIINGNSSFSTTLDFLVVSKITDFLPVSQINLNNLKIPQELADPNFGVPGKVDLLIGAEAFFDIIKEGIIRTTDNALVFRSSVFRYIATGTTHSYKQNQYCGFVSEMQNIDDNLQKFWEIETINEVQKPLSKEEEYCENHYQMTHTRNEAGRYVVQMPVKDIQCLGHSKGNFAAIHTHLDLEHMEKVEEHFDETFANNICYYLPHHGVFRPDKTTTKLKVVFNGSASTTSGLSLNDLLLKGEVKEDIFEIMIRLSAHKYAFTTEIRMMLRQILNDPAQRDLLRIIWKTGAIEEPVIYRLKTVTYGTSSAPFLAVRTLKQLAMDEASRFPFASKVALQDVYMDDIVSGAQDLDTARQLQCQLQNMLETCGMKLRKWNSNSKELLNSSSDQEHSFSTNAESAIKTLGISWKPTGDFALRQFCLLT
ncbi:integrase catalytic domain-containing protein [Trichonephila clavipes]|nr:integrase catalytic domain-containing protein [Trichonephila clavipes]